jgi:AcrR family transcriptional regulator
VPRRATPSRPARRRLDASERRERITLAASRLFGELGYGRTSIDRIAQAAGITVPVVYDHFASKRDLYVALLGRHAQRLVEATTRLDADASIEEVLRANVSSFFAFVEEHPDAWRMLFVDSTGDPQIAAVHEQIQRQATERLAATVVAAASELHLGVDVPRHVAEEMLAELGKSALNGLAIWWWAHPETPRDVVSAVAVDLLWRGVRDIVGEGAQASRGR